MFPSTHWRDLSTFSRQGLVFSTPSDTAVKMFDALMHQMLYHYDDPQLGGYAGTVDKMFEADPDFAMGHIVTLALDCFASNPERGGRKPRVKLADFSQKAAQRKDPLSQWEQGHLRATQLLAAEDWVGAMDQYEMVLAGHPLDTTALDLSYTLALVSGHTSRMRDIPMSVIRAYRPDDSFYGHMHGKLAFGQCETGELEAGELSARLALDHFPRDNWAHHAMAHVFEETGRTLQGRHFLENTEPDWTQGHTFANHLWWHKALMHISLGELETALGLYDEKVGPLSLKDRGMFSLSDGSALLLRLQLEGVDIGDRAREQARAWQDHNGECVSLFYDGHVCFASLLAGDGSAVSRLLDSIRDYARGEGRRGWNKEVTARLGEQLMSGISRFFDGDYSAAVACLGPIMEDLMVSLQGSKAQKDVFRQILLHAAIRSGTEEDLALANNALQQKLSSSNHEKHLPIDQRLADRILQKHTAPSKDI